MPAHNTAKADPGQLALVHNVLKKIRTGQVEGKPESGSRLVFEVDGITLLTAPQVLAQQKSDTSQGGSGLTTWPQPD